MWSFLQLGAIAARLWVRREGDQHAAALAYFTPFALTPLIILSISIVGFLYGAERVIAMLVRWGNAIDPGITTLMYESVQNFDSVSNYYYVPVVGTIFLSIMIFVTVGSLMGSLHKMWDVTVSGWGSYVSRLWRILLFIVVLQIYLVATLLLHDTIAFFNEFRMWGGWSLIGFIASLFLTMLLLAITYGLLALRAPSFRGRFVGAAVASLILLFSRELVALHFATMPAQSLFGAAGLLITLLVWIYVVAGVILYGAAFAKVYDEAKLKDLATK